MHKKFEDKLLKRRQALEIELTNIKASYEFIKDPSTKIGRASCRERV